MSSHFSDPAMERCLILRKLKNLAPFYVRKNLAESLVSEHCVLSSPAVSGGPSSKASKRLRRICP